MKRFLIFGTLFLSISENSLIASSNNDELGISLLPSPRKLTEKEQKISAKDQTLEVIVQDLTPEALGTIHAALFAQDGPMLPMDIAKLVGEYLSRDFLYQIPQTTHLLTIIDRRTKKKHGNPLDVGQDPTHAVFWNNTVYVSSGRKDTVLAIDTNTQKITVTNVGLWPTYMAPEGDRCLWVASSISDTIYPIGKDNKITAGQEKGIKVGKRPVCALASGGWVYVANSLSHSVSVVNTSTCTVVKTIETKSNPQQLFKTPTGIEVRDQNGRVLLTIQEESSEEKEKKEKKDEHTSLISLSSSILQIHPH